MKTLDDVKLKYEKYPRVVFNYSTFSIIVTVAIMLIASTAYVVHNRREYRNLTITVDHVGAQQEPIQVEPIVEVKTEAEIRKELVVENPKGCTSSQLILYPDGECKDKLIRVTYTGNKQEWLRASGIPEASWWAVDYIVIRESGWNPNAVNSNGGACGLGQQLPCGKWAGAWNDPVAALKAMNIYVNKYGGWAGAVSFWKTHSWY